MNSGNRPLFIKLGFILFVLIAFVIFAKYQEHKRELYYAAIDICVERGNLASECLQEGYVQEMNPDSYIVTIGGYVFTIVCMLVLGLAYKMFKEKFEY